ncbi:hypothetical protein LJR269_006630 [Duganella sp. LjRoot269]
MERPMAKFFDRLTQSCQSGASAAALAGLLTAAASAGAQPAWAHQAQGFQSNGAITVKSLSGGAYGAKENPTGAVASANQSAVTQPPTVIIQATGSALPFNYKDDCWLFYPPTGLSYQNESAQRMGLGKIDTLNNFTGLIAGHVTGYTALLTISTGASISSSSVNTILPSSPAGIWGTCSSASSGYVCQVIALPIRMATKCYP